MTDKDTSISTKKNKTGTNAPIPPIGEPLDGRHFLDVVEEQQYSGKPFVKQEQDVVFEQDKTTGSGQADK